MWLCSIRARMTRAVTIFSATRASFQGGGYYYHLFTDDEPGLRKIIRLAQVSS